MMRSPVEIQKIHDKCQAHPVDQIANNPADHGRKRQPMDQRLRQEEASEKDKRQEHDHGEHGQPPVQPTQNAPRRTGIPHVSEIEKAGEHDKPATGKELITDPILGELVQNHNAEAKE